MYKHLQEVRKKPKKTYQGFYLKLQIENNNKHDRNVYKQ